MTRAPLRRHRLEPARLVLGLALIAIAVLATLRAHHRVDFSPRWLLVALPVVLLSAAAVAVVTYTLRRRRDARGGEPGDRPEI